MAARTESIPNFDLEVIFENWGNGQKTLPEDNDLMSSIISTFNLLKTDDYVYHAMASVTLAQVQQAINHGAGSGLHAWYADEEGKPVRTVLPHNDFLLDNLIQTSSISH